MALRVECSRTSTSVGRTLLWRGPVPSQGVPSTEDSALSSLISASVLPAWGCAAVALSCLQPRETASPREDAPVLVLFPRLQLLHGDAVLTLQKGGISRWAGTSQRPDCVLLWGEGGTAGAAACVSYRPEALGPTPKTSHESAPTQSGQHSSWASLPGPLPRPQKRALS